MTTTFDAEGRPFQVDVKRVREGNPPRPGKVDAGPVPDGVNNKYTEVGPASATGVPKKAEELKGLNYLPEQKTAIFYHKESAIPTTGDVREFVELSQEQTDALADKVKKMDHATNEKVWQEAERLADGKTRKIVVSETAAKAGKTILERLVKAGKVALPVGIGAAVSAPDHVQAAETHGLPYAGTKAALDETPVIEWVIAVTELLGGEFNGWADGAGSMGRAGYRDPEEVRVLHDHGVRPANAVVVGPGGHVYYH